MVAFLLLIIGGINWGLIGLFNWGIDSILGSGLSKIVYILVGLAAVYELATHKHTCKTCGSKSAPADPMPESSMPE